MSQAPPPPPPEVPPAPEAKAGASEAKPSSSLGGGVSPAPPQPTFFREMASILNAGRSRSLILAGQVHDLFYFPSSDTHGNGEGATASAGTSRLARPPGKTSCSGGVGGCYVPLVDYLATRCRVDGLLVLVCELNGSIRVMPPPDHAAAERGSLRGASEAAGTPRGASGGWHKLRTAHVAWRLGQDRDELIPASLADKPSQRRREQVEAEFDAHARDAIGQPTLALEFLRQLTLCSRSRDAQGRAFLDGSLLLIIEAADLMLPAGNGDDTRLGPADRHRIAIARDWFSDPGFMDGQDSVVMLADSAALIHPRVARLPSVLSIPVEPPDEAARLHYIEHHLATPRHGSAALPQGDAPPTPTVKLWSTPRALALLSSGLSIHALRQLLLLAEHRGEPLRPGDVVAQVERFINAELGGDVVEFKKPTHSLDDVVGAAKLKVFLREEFIPMLRDTDAAEDTSGGTSGGGAVVAGPIGGGKTFIFEAVAAALDMPVLVLKDIRGQWRGQTDIAFEKLRGVLMSLGRVVVFVDEADTQFGGVGTDAHDTGCRLTGKVRQMMSDPALRGRVVWLLMTARVHRLSPDLRRPGRVGDLIIPVLDPAPGSDDRWAFLRWAIEPALGKGVSDTMIEQFDLALDINSAAGFAALRGRLKGLKARKGGVTMDDALAVAHDQLTPDIAAARRYQTLQALLNTTRRSLLPDAEVAEAQREAWATELAELERRGVS